MNTDSIVVLRSDFPTGHPFQTQAIAGTTTSEQLFQVSSVSATTAVVTIPSQTAILGSGTPANPNVNPALLGNPPGVLNATGKPGFTSTSFDGRAFRVRAMGKYNQQANTTNAQTVTFYLTLGNAASSTKRIATIASATNLASGAGNWLVEAELLWDSTSTNLDGWYQGLLSSGYTSPTTLTNNPTAAAVANLQFCCSVVFSTSNASSTASLVEFSLEQI